MIDSLIELDKRLFLALNELHASWLDPIMVWSSGNLIWLPLYAFLLYQLTRLPRTQALAAVLCVVIGITLADQFTSTLLKPMVARARPTWDVDIGPLVHTVDNYRGGNFGFPSSHAANTFCVAVLLTLILRKPWNVWLFLWAAIVSYSRIYLGVHYPADILAGALIGTGCGCIAFQLYKTGCRIGEKLIVEKKAPDKGAP